MRPRGAVFLWALLLLGAGRPASSQTTPVRLTSGASALPSFGGAAALSLTGLLPSPTFLPAAAPMRAALSAALPRPEIESAFAPARSEVAAPPGEVLDAGPIGPGAGAPASEPAASSGDIPAQPKIPSDYLPVPVTVQETSYSCGAAAALAVLRYWKAYAGGERSLYELLDTRPKDGTPPENIADGLARLGLAASLRENMSLDDLRAALRRGESAILDIQAWREDESTPWSDRWEDGHYVILIGMDERYAYLMDPSTEEGYAYLPVAELLERWHDYEDRGGIYRRHYQLGILVKGATPLDRPAQPPADPSPIKLRRGPRSLPSAP
ncbi:MAG: C39 family peptidase [Elusimicrobia bacterium]|nr:C39 family peptidase [Elusimicrobiota bacterium]